eukprot:227792-Rhodomonas_salina.1
MTPTSSFLRGTLGNSASPGGKQGSIWGCFLSVLARFHPTSTNTCRRSALTASECPCSQRARAAQEGPARWLGPADRPVQLRRHRTACGQLRNARAGSEGRAPEGGARHTAHVHRGASRAVCVRVGFVFAVR